MKPSQGNSPLRLARRRALQLGAAGAGVVGTAAWQRAAIARNLTQATPAATPISGNGEPSLAAFDELVQRVMASWQIPGAQLAIAQGDRLVYSRGFGYADLDAQETVLPTHLFRIASTSKPITGVAILKLVQDGLLTLDTPVFSLLGLEAPVNAPYDARLGQVTIEHLLVHSGGWDSASTQVDPQYLPWPLLASHVLGAESPAEGDTIVRYMLGQPLDFDPGTQSAYSNFGFNVLGRVIEHVSGQSYEDYVRNEILAPAGVTAAVIGGTTLADRAAGEVRYYGPANQEPRASVYPGEGYVPVAYGSYYLRAMDSHGGWISSAEDLVRFALAVDGTRGEALLTPESVSTMVSTPRPPSVSAGAGNAEGGFGLAWNTTAVDDGYEWTHAGALEGSNASWLYRSANGLTVAWVVNTLPENYGEFFGDFIPAVVAALGEVTSWPETDLFA